MNVPKDHSYYLKRAYAVSEKSQEPPALETHVGCVIVSPDGEILVEEHNQFARGLIQEESRYKDREMKQRYSVHAEVRAILRGLADGKKLAGATLYVVPFAPCIACARTIVETGIKHTVMEDISFVERWKAEQDFALGMFKEAGISVTVVPAVERTPSQQKALDIRAKWRAERNGTSPEPGSASPKPCSCCGKG